MVSMWCPSHTDRGGASHAGVYQGHVAVRDVRGPAAGGGVRRRAADQRRRAALGGRGRRALGLCDGAGGVRPGVAARRGAPQPGDAGAAAGVPDRLRLRGPGRRRHAADATRCSSWPAGGCRRAGRTWPASRRSRGWRTRSIATPSSALAAALVDAVRPRARARGGPPRGSCWTWTGPTTRPTASRRGWRYHGYYRQHMYHPLLVFDGDTGHLITAVLRPGNVHGSRFVVLVLRRLLPRAAGGLARRARSSCGPTAASPSRACTPGARPTRSTYTIGLIPNPVLERAGRPAPGRGPGPERRRRAARRSAWPARPATRPSPGPARAGSSSRPRCWPRARTPASSSPPATDDPLAALRLVRRSRRGRRTGSRTSRTPSQADRLSDHRFWANAFRLLLHAAAYWLLDTLRRWLARRRGAARLQLDTLRLRLLKIGGRVRELADRVRLSLASSHPGEPLWLALAHRLTHAR